MIWNVLSGTNQLFLPKEKMLIFSSVDLNQNSYFVSYVLFNY